MLCRSLLEDTSEGVGRTGKWPGAFGKLADVAASGESRWAVLKVSYLKKIPKHEPTSSYFHLVVCLRECMMICGENNDHVHDGYKEDMAPSSDVNDTDEEESNNSILHETFHKPSSENLSMDVRKSE